MKGQELYHEQICVDNERNIGYQLLKGENNEQYNS